MLACFYDLAKDIRFNDYRDKIDRPLLVRYSGQEFTDCNKEALSNSFQEVKDRAQVILEIGVHRNHDQSSTDTFLSLKKPETYYFGVDIEDKSYLDNPEKRIYTIKSPSENVLDVLTKVSNILKKPIDEIRIDYLFIDGWHSIQQVMVDWEYSRLVTDGIIGFHDTNDHLGPSRFVQNLSPEKFDVSIQCKDDYGISFVKRR